jgi:hypothetical protein
LTSPHDPIISPGRRGPRRFQHKKRRHHGPARRAVHDRHAP